MTAGEQEQNWVVGPLLGLQLTLNMIVLLLVSYIGTAPAKKTLIDKVPSGPLGGQDCLQEPSRARQHPEH